VLFVLSILFVLAYALKKAIGKTFTESSISAKAGRLPVRLFSLTESRTMMQLYSGTTCAFSHRCRFVLYEKGMDFQVIDVDMYNKPEDIAVMNPYNRLPVLVERDLILYESNIINEYIDERFPHPQLMPADPVMRARARLMLFNMEVELFSQIEALESGKEKQVERARAHVTDRLIELAPVFTKTKHMLGDDFTMLDVAIAPLLWRLDHYGIRLTQAARR
jgi:RNA polymerase-associated protein